MVIDLKREMAERDRKHKLDMERMAKEQEEIRRAERDRKHKEDMERMAKEQEEIRRAERGEFRAN
jgi:hypothetical protein